MLALVQLLGDSYAALCREQLSPSAFHFSHCCFALSGVAVALLPVEEADGDRLVL